MQAPFSQSPQRPHYGPVTRHLVFSFGWESEHVLIKKESSRIGTQDILQWDSGMVGLSILHDLRPQLSLLAEQAGAYCARASCVLFKRGQNMSRSERVWNNSQIWAPSPSSRVQ